MRQPKKSRILANNSPSSKIEALRSDNIFVRRVSRTFECNHVKFGCCESYLYRLFWKVRFGHCDDTTKISISLVHIRVNKHLVALHSQTFGDRNATVDFQMLPIKMLIA